MTKFTKEAFSYSSGWLWYEVEGKKKFVARFKYSKTPVTRAKFQKALIKNYTVEEYFAKMDAGKAPLHIFREDGVLVFDGNKLILDGKVL